MRAENSMLMKRDEIVIERLKDGPIITALTKGLLPCDRENINGPCIIRSPDWMPSSLGTYYLYFSNHRGNRIQLAYGDSIAGPWTVYPGGAITIQQTLFDHHIASPDVHVDKPGRRVVMFFHGKKSDVREQFSLRSVSEDGIHFTCETRPLSRPYLRVFEHLGQFYAIASNRTSAIGYTSNSLYGDFVLGPEFLPSCRHTSVLVRGEFVHIFYSRIGDLPECLLHTKICLSDLLARGWPRSIDHGTEILRPDLPWEGAGYPLTASCPGPATRVNQLRDPFAFAEGEDNYLLYTVAGETAIAAAKLQFHKDAG